MSTRESFALQAVVHLVRPWGGSAGNLDELRQGLAAAPGDVLFHHAVQYQLRHPAGGELPPDDFSAWVGGAVQDRQTSERFSFVVQTHNSCAAALREALLEVLDALPARDRVARFPADGGRFVFLSSTSVTLPTGLTVRSAVGLVDALMQSDPGVWFYHLIEEPWFRRDRGSLLDWLHALGESRLAGWLQDAAGDCLPIQSAQARVSRQWRRSRVVRQVADAAQVPEDVRREAGRQAVARFVRRVTRPGPRS